MFEKVNPSHPDKIADRIAGAIVDLAYRKSDNPKVAVEVLIGHGECNIIIESDVLSVDETAEQDAQAIMDIVARIAGESLDVNICSRPQDKHLSDNQSEGVKCGDNGIFKGVPTSEEEEKLTRFAVELYRLFPYDGKFILNGKDIIICQSNLNEATSETVKGLARSYGFKVRAFNPLGDWTGGIDVDSGATNRKLGSDMGRCVTGGGLHGKDLSKADVSVNIYAYLKAQETGVPVELCCAIGDEEIDGKPYSGIVETAREFIRSIGGFEKFAEWGLI